MNRRFNSFIESDLSLVSTFLDPRFGIASIIDEGHKCLAKARVTALVIQHMNRPVPSTDSSEELVAEPKTQKQRVSAQMEDNFIFDDDEPVIENTKDCIDSMIDEFTVKLSFRNIWSIRSIQNNTCTKAYKIRYYYMHCFEYSECSECSEYSENSILPNLPGFLPLKAKKYLVHWISGSSMRYYFLNFLCWQRSF